ncbi:MAG: response regulator transcription factor [Piscirickettsiaceae bacterium]|nr:response regulator transcription factor [Piscirickettsiaceae bacterium]
MAKQTNYRLEQLSQLDLPSQIFIPALLQELHFTIPSLSNTFCWQDDDGSLSNIYDEVSNTTILKKFIISLSNTTPKKHNHINSCIIQLAKPITSFEHTKQYPFLAECYKTVLLPLGYVNTCFIPIFHDKTSKRLGLLMIHRAKNDNPFSEDDYLNLEFITSIIAEGLAPPNHRPLFMTDGLEQGILIVDSIGELQRACPMGEKLLSMASSPTFNLTSSANFSPYNLHVFPQYSDLIQTILDTDNKREVPSFKALTIKNAWGEFKLHSFMIEDKAGRRSAQIGLNIRRQEPFSLTLFRKIKKLKLTPRQETVSLLYASGDHHQTIAEKLNLSLYTVKEHVKNITTRLDIHSRADLIELILCD